jgi:hypothetical protein
LEKVRDADGDEPGRDDHGPGHDLIEDLPPGPDNEVIRKSNREDMERSWFLGVFLGLLALTIIADLAGGAWLSAHAWAQVKPEIASIRTFLFQVAGVIIGFYFGSSVRHRHRMWLHSGCEGSAPEQPYGCSGVLISTLSHDSQGRQAISRFTDSRASEANLCGSLMNHRRDDDEPCKHHERHQRPSGRHAGPAFSVAILVPPTVTVSIPQTPAHDRLLTVPGTARRVTDSVSR